MIFNAIKNLFNKDENAEQIEYLGTDKDGNKIYEGYYHEFKGIPWVFNKTTYTREEKNMIKKMVCGKLKSMLALKQIMGSTLLLKSFFSSYIT